MLPGKQNIAEVLEHCISNVDKHLHDRIMPLLEERADIKVKIAGVSLMSEGQGGPVGCCSFRLAVFYLETQSICFKYPLTGSIYFFIFSTLFDNDYRVIG